MKVMSDLREAMWGVVQAGREHLDDDYHDYAATHFDRLLANASTPDWTATGSTTPRPGWPVMR